VPVAALQRPLGQGLLAEQETQVPSSQMGVVPEQSPPLQHS
jgi:hypothetical protein